MLTFALFTNIATVVATLLLIIIISFKWRYQYWQRRNLPYLPPKIPFGTSSNPFTVKEHVGFRMKRLYDTMKKKGWKHGGLFFFTNPTYLVIDLDYVKNIMTRDYQYFVDRGMYHDEENDPLSAHLFAIGGQKWRHLRTKLTPTFTSGKMKMMFQTLIDCTPHLLSKIEENSKSPIDIKEVLGCFTTDVVGSCAFGLDCNSFKDENSPFRMYGKKALTNQGFQLFKLIVAMSLPNVAKFFKMAITPRDVTEFFMKVVKETIEYRKKNNVTRNDFLQLLIELRNQPNGLTMNQVVAQSFVFFLAGYETSSTLMTFVLYELARNPDLQEKVRSEILRCDQTYESLQELKFLDQVINEALRMYPPVTLLTRKCVKDYKIPDEDVIIEKGTSVMIPVFAIHYDQEYYPDPEKFDPERFSEELKNKRHHYAHLPFGEGPRICIGMRFGLMQSKVGLVSLLKNYKFSINEKTKQPLKMKVRDFIFNPEGGIWLNAEKI